MESRPMRKRSPNTSQRETPRPHTFPRLSAFCEQGQHNGVHPPQTLTPAP